MEEVGREANETPTRADRQARGGARTETGGVQAGEGKQEGKEARAAERAREATATSLFVSFICNGPQELQEQAQEVRPCPLPPPPLVIIINGFFFSTSSPSSSCFFSFFFILCCCMLHHRLRFAERVVANGIETRLSPRSGLTIHSIHHHLVQCHACFQSFPQDQDENQATTSSPSVFHRPLPLLPLSQQFCPHCGHAALVSVNMSVDARTGHVRYHVPYKRIHNLHGTIFSIPKPQGGRNSHDLILRPDDPR